ncbi:glycosyltransferase involved in cell wall biosynthesis [Nitrospirillum amazonense]|uniref:Glycosyltransferase involved in cell wall biosynthesis n=1 Tax=Nitrospirillum amazonense TaxID=28077 RepID=A0A560FLG8_9PROT|nr:glycosyltransferase family 4 protein [Nitrospirillum amazonense]TWB22455.1 glycosyltransferase involved in cell wall biosynthesis [Nitrospirillum amazonense]
MTLTHTPGTVTASTDTGNPAPAPDGASSDGAPDGTTIAGWFGGGRPVVLQVIPNLVTGGAERGCVDMAAALMRAGGTALVASGGGPMARELERYKAEHITLPLASKNPFTIWRNASRLETLIRERGVDIIHARSRAPAWSAWIAARRTGIPFVTTFHAPYNFKGEMKRRYNAVMAKGDRVIAVSRFVAEHVASQYGVGPERLRTIPRGVDTVNLDPERVSQERLIKLARDWRLPEDQRIVLLPGRLTRWKGQLDLIEAIARLKRDDVRAVLVGSDQGRTEYRAELVARIRDLGLEGQVTIADHCNDMAAAYLLSDVVVSASARPEAFGRVIVEAQAMGKPVIVTNHGAVAETVVDGETGLVVPPGDPATMAAAIAEALALDGLQRRALAADARRFVLQNYTRERMCDATLAVYAELLHLRATVGMAAYRKAGQ